MGGPMGVHDTDQYNWITREKHFIEQALKQHKKVLGICLGAQFMADVLGAKVYKNTEKEIGWYPVHRSKDADDTPLAEIIPDQFFAFHWHGDTFDLPTGAAHLAQSAATPHQAFIYGPGAIGLQFHLESTQESIKGLIQHCSNELVSAPYIQSKEEILKQIDRIAPSNAIMDAILSFLQG